MKRFVFLLSAVLVCGLLLTACGTNSGSGGGSAGPNTITMSSVRFSQDVITIKKGDTLTFTSDVNGSPHILAIGQNGNPQAEAGAPDFGGNAGKQLQPGDSWTTPPWNTPGTYHVTCTVHPTTMNLTVTVTD